ncbi:nuclear transport factor 2 family protein [Amycolatopsis magusensis]|uniref:nuclear transport factor 2 family protein n=1 Tax=Amycolatopsis magusensis TaxID=882444 RepID=UPI0024A9864A|nr:nuclear transport factor 2 family protein [Amycolatopsis magusensis]MDI5980193.1 nuclear transport factor 2 family protein [Amycolatopsis magusensis]
MRRLLDLVLAKDMDAVADLWAEDGTAEFPFASGASPRRLAGREEVRAYLTGFPEVFDVREIPAITVHTTERADTAVVEYHANGHSVRTGEAYRMDYIVVITVRDGLITRFRDYWNPLANAAAAGALPELLDSLRPGTGR